MIRKTIFTFDQVLPTEDPQKLMDIINECRRRPDASERVDFSEERELLEKLTARVRGLLGRYKPEGSDNTMCGSRRDAGYSDFQL